MLQLYVTRSKIFLGLDKTGTERRFILGRGTLPQAAPDWVRDTPTFKLSIKDKSIVDLTPPTPVAAMEPEVSPEDPVEPEGIEETEDGSMDLEAPAAKPVGKGKKTGGRAVGLQ